MRFFPQDADRFSKLAAGFQSLVLAFGLIIAGVLGVSVLHSWERARAELEEIKRRLHHTELDLTVDARQEVAVSGRYIGIQVTVANKGNNAVRLRFDQKPPIRVSQVLYDSERDGPPNSFGPEIDAQLYADFQPDTIVLDKDMLPTEIYRFNAMLHVRGPGVYFVLFETAVDLLDLRGVGRSKGRWLSSTYVIVR
jgi:hypothetical protein